MAFLALGTFRIRAFDKVAKRWVRVDSIAFDHLGKGEPLTLTTEGVTWVVSRFDLEIEIDGREGSPTHPEGAPA